MTQPLQQSIDGQMINTVFATLEIMGHIVTKEPDDSEFTYPKSLLLGFKSTDDIRKAIADGFVRFGFSEDNTAIAATQVVADQPSDMASDERTSCPDIRQVAGFNEAFELACKHGSVIPDAMLGGRTGYYFDQCEFSHFVLGIKNLSVSAEAKRKQIIHDSWLAIDELRGEGTDHLMEIPLSDSIRALLASNAGKASSDQIARTIVDPCGDALNSASWVLSEALPVRSLSGHGWNHLKPALCKAIQHYLDFAPASSEPAVAAIEAVTDTQRLDFILENTAFTTEQFTDAGGISHQLFSQDEDEDFHCLHDRNRFYPSAREAIDAALASTPAITPEK